MAGTIKKGNPRKRSKRGSTKFNNEKARCEFIHASRRLEERYGEYYSFELRSKILKEIRLGGSSIIERKRQSLNKALYLMVLDGSVYKFVFDKKRKEVITFLPVEKEKATGINW